MHGYIVHQRQRLRNAPCHHDGATARHQRALKLPKATVAPRRGKRCRNANAARHDAQYAGSVFTLEQHWSKFAMQHETLCNHYAP